MAAVVWKYGVLKPYAQLALGQCRWHALCSKVKFVLPSASDNTSVESGINKFVSTAEPLGPSLGLAATCRICTVCCSRW